jgi:hypothetical protein
MTPPERRVSEYLMARPYVYVCDGCLTERPGLPLAMVADQATILASTTLYERDTRICVECGDRGLVTRALVASE